MSAGVRPVRWNRGSGSQVAVVRWQKAWRRCRHLPQVAVAVAIVIVLTTQRRSLLSAVDRLGRISPVWLAVALAAETVSFFAAAELQHHLLIGAGTRVDRGSLIALSYAGTAMSATLPAGPAVSTRYTYRILTRRGTTAGAAAWVLAATAVLSLVTLAPLGLIGAQIRGFGVLCSAVGVLVAVAALLATAGAVTALVWSSRHRARLEQLASLLTTTCHKGCAKVARRMGRAYPRADRVRGRMRRAYPPADRVTGGAFSACKDGVEQHRSLGPARLSAALGLASANWLADIAALAIAFVALGLDVPWQGLLLAYAVSQLATSIPLLPGSIGVAEGSMAAALVCSGVHPSAAVAGVLVYRLVSFWLVLPAGWLAWTRLNAQQSRGAALASCGSG